MAAPKKLDENFSNLEFSRATDNLIGVITEYQTRAGKPTDAKTVLAIAKELLKERISL